MGQEVEVMHAVMSRIIIIIITSSSSLTGVCGCGWQMMLEEIITRFRPKPEEELLSTLHTLLQR
jgi:hypothetical protein